MKSLRKAVFVASFLPLCWLGMMAVHELGHVLGAWLTGGTVTRVVLHPLAISRTDVAPNPYPLVVAWAGPVVGVLLPLVVWSVSSLARLPAVSLIRFFTGFCLIANGAYLGLGSFGRIGDSGDILQHGSPVWLLWLFGGASIAGGLWLWHGLGPRFGLAGAHADIGARMVYAFVVLLFLAIAAAVIFRPPS